ncbi:MAG TPA: transglutaminase domain-containing protein [Planctomycetaceae bacterium]|nr:transglutaminase domain-containing protein [Planctomycetaceae bacterium]
MVWSISQVNATTLLICVAINLISSDSLAQDFGVPGLRLESKEFFLKQKSELAAMKEGTVTFAVQQNVRLDQIPKGAKEILIWIAIPSDEAHQKVLSLSENSIPGDHRIVQDKDRLGKFLHSRITNPNTTELEFLLEYTLSRAAVYTQIDLEQVLPLSELERSMLSEHLAKDALHMAVTSKVQSIADEVCGTETNIALRAMLIMKHVAQSVDHYSYSKDPAMPRCGLGDAEACLAQGGGCCTDLNSLLVALARARDIPARLNMGYRLLKENSGQWVDPGYRCWVEYYVPGYGWISADVVEADTPDGKGHVRWLTGLTARRVWLNQGRQFRFADAQSTTPVNHMHIAYAEIDGKPARILPEGDLTPQLTRTIKFDEVVP